VVLEFDDCQQASLRWSANDAAYGSGEISIQRLTFVHAVKCDLPPPNALPSGLYSGYFRWNGRGVRAGTGIVDLEGRLWGLERTELVLGFRFPISYGRALQGHPTGVDGARVDAQGVGTTNGWATDVAVSRAAYEGFWDTAALPIRGAFKGVANTDHTWDGPLDLGLVAPVSMSQLSGEFEFLVPHFPPAASNGRLTVGLDGTVCVVIRPDESLACDFEGTLATPEGDAGLIDFEIRSTTNEALPPYRGRGWLAMGEQGQELVLSGDNGFTGFGLEGRR
jgi:hypothetical protein